MSKANLLFNIPIDLIKKDIKKSHDILKEKQLSKSKRIFFIVNNHSTKSQNFQVTTINGEQN